MLNQLVEFGKGLRDPNESDALKQEFFAIDLVIDHNGNFKEFIVHDDKATRAEALTSKKGKARLLLDKAEEVLGFDAKKHALFLDKLNSYQDVVSLKPVLQFYQANKQAGLESAATAFAEQVPEKIRIKNLAFLLLGESVRLHENVDVVAAIIARFDAEQQQQKVGGQKLCSICGTADFPILDKPHGMIKKVPDGQSSGCALVSYNEKAFESYGLTGNENSSICSACARNYVEGLSYLMGNGAMYQPETGKAYFKYSNRKNLASDTALIYWTRSLAPVPELELLENANRQQDDIFTLIAEATSSPAGARPEDLALLLSSPQRGIKTTLESVDADRFYACTLSGAAARISIRSWIESTAPAIKQHIAGWFCDTAMLEYNYEHKQMLVRFFSLRELASACGVHKKKTQGDKTYYELEKKDPFIGKAATMLWNCALLGAVPALTLLDRVLRRIKTEAGRVTAARVALLRLILNRRTQWQTTGAQKMHEKLDQENTNTAYVAGRIFAVLESIQTAALGKELNAPIRDRFFSFAATNPSSAFGRLLKLSQSHLSKLRIGKPGLAVNLDKKLGELFCKITELPPTFSLEEQGLFAIGYYHQRQDNFAGGTLQPTENDTTTEQGE